MISVLLADDHPLVLRGLSDLLTPCADLKIVGQEVTGPRVAESVARLAPDILVMDLMMPGADGMDTIRQVARSRPATRIIVLSMHAHVAYVWEALRNGALGYVLKCTEGDELILAVREAAAGRRYLSAAISTQELDDYAQKAQQRGLGLHDTLTRREKQVLRLVAEGHTSAEIARQLQIGTRTVETYRANILLKLGLHNHTELVRHAIMHGIIPPA